MALFVWESQSFVNYYGGIIAIDADDAESAQTKVLEYIKTKFPLSLGRESLLYYIKGEPRKMDILMLCRSA